MTTTKTLHRLIGSLAAVTLALCAFAAPNASAAFGIVDGSLDGSVLDAGGEPFTQAGGHPASAGVHFDFNRAVDDQFGTVVSDGGDVKDIFVEVPPGFVGNATAVPTCSRARFFDTLGAGCPADTQVGVASVDTELFNSVITVPASVYNLEAPAGVPAEFGFAPAGIVTLARPTLRSDGDYGITFRTADIPQLQSLLSISFDFWGVPADPIHDNQRGESLFTLFFGVNVCAAEKIEGEVVPTVIGPPCPSNAPELPFLTNPTDCSHGPFDTTLRVVSWQGDEDSEVFTSHDNLGNPIGATGCEKVPFDPTIVAAPTTELAGAPSGLDFELKMPDDGLLNPTGVAQSQPKRTEVTLPEGVTINAAAGEGLTPCTPADYARETATSAPGEGCPNGAKLGTVEVKSPLLAETAEGSLYIAQQDDPRTTAHGAENPFDSLLAIYLVAKVPERGVVVKLAGKVSPDPKTGQLITVFDDLPQLPVESFRLHFREGARSTLVTPPACGTYPIVAKFTPWSASDPDNPAPGEVVTTTSSFKITKGGDGGACPPAGVPPFRPEFSAGSINNNAGSYSPFNMRLVRHDGEQDMTKFSATLPPGVVAKLAGVSKCPEGAIAVARAKRGREEQASPSCPANSQIGHILAGAGVGGVLTYVEGKVYLGGPYGGAPLSAIVITPAVAGPFDVGTVITREALNLNPTTAEVSVDGEHSDPIPYILEGIPLKVRDIRVYTDRPEFTLNPTSCDPSQVGARLWGSFLDVFSSADDVPVALSTRYQTANCLTLGFKPQLNLHLNGGTARGAHPGLRAVLNARPGDANIGAAVVTLPRSAFLDQAHIRTICTRVQFAADQCPKGAQYGYARAFTPLLDEPIEGPVYLRSSNHQLPDLVADLHGLVDVEIVGRIDSFRGGIRSSFETVPDARVSKFVLRMQGGKKGLIVNSRDLCAGVAKATARFTGQNGKVHNFRPVMRADCKGKVQRHKRHRPRASNGR